MKNQININNNIDDEDKINIPKLKEEKKDKSFIDTIFDFFRSSNTNDNKTPNKDSKIPNIKGGYIKCSCPKNHSKYYCDNIYEIMGMLKSKNIDSAQNKKL